MFYSFIPKFFICNFCFFLAGCANQIESRINRDLAAAYVSIEKVYALCLDVTPASKISDCGSEYIYNLSRLPPHPQLAVEKRYASRLKNTLLEMQSKKTKDWNRYNEMNTKFLAQYKEEIKVALSNGNYVSNYPNSSHSYPSSSANGSFSSIQSAPTPMLNKPREQLNALPVRQWTPLIDSAGNSLGRVNTGGGFNSHGTIHDNNGNYSGKVDMGGGFNSNGSVYDKNGNYIGKLAPR